MSMFGCALVLVGWLAYYLMVGIVVGFLRWWLVEGRPGSFWQWLNRE